MIMYANRIIRHNNWILRNLGIESEAVVLIRLEDCEIAMTCCSKYVYTELLEYTVIPGSLIISIQIQIHCISLQQLSLPAKAGEAEETFKLVVRIYQKFASNCKKLVPIQRFVWRERCSVVNRYNYQMKCVEEPSAFSRGKYPSSKINDYFATGQIIRQHGLGESLLGSGPTVFIVVSWFAYAGI